MSLQRVIWLDDLWGRMVRQGSGPQNLPQPLPLGEVLMLGGEYGVIGGGGRQDLLPPTELDDAALHGLSVPDPVDSHARVLNAMGEPMPMPMPMPMLMHHNIPMLPAPLP